jgi:hypothetical protein
MQRALIVIVMLALVAVAISAGTLAAHWPFWQRAWQWHSAAQGWPEKLAGPTLTLQPATVPTPLTMTMDPTQAHRCCWWPMLPATPARISPPLRTSARA